MKQFSDCGITIRNTGESSPSTNHIIVEDCEIVNCDNSGIIVTSKNHNVGDAGAQPSVITIRDNEVSYVNEDVASNEAITIHDTKDCEVYDNYVHHYYKEGIDVKKGCENVEVFRNIVTVNLGSYAGAGIYIDGAQAGLTNIDVYDNLVFNGHAGIYVAFESGAGTGNAVEDVLIYNNVVWGSDESEFRLCKCNSSTGLIKNSKVFNNTFEGSVDKWVVSITETVASKIENFQFKNNIVARSVVGTEDLFHHVSGVASKLTIDTNLYYNNGSTYPGAKGTNVIKDDPDFEFESWTGWPYSSIHFLAATSPAIEEGLTLSEVADDIAGTSRPDGDEYDIGAFEGPH